MPKRDVNGWLIGVAFPTSGPRYSVVISRHTLAGDNITTTVYHLVKRRANLPSSGERFVANSVGGAATRRAALAAEQGRGRGG
ncbi:MAG: hypothetical protein ABIQ44_00365 [Chloroflexia bacterium]